jgi:hypothetical protein
MLRRTRQISTPGSTLTTIRSRNREFFNEINVRGVLIFLANGYPTRRGGGHDF